MLLTVWWLQGCVVHAWRWKRCCGRRHVTAASPVRVQTRLAGGLRKLSSVHHGKALCVTLAAPAQAAEAAAARDAAARDLDEAQETLYGQVGDLKQQVRRGGDRARAIAPMAQMRVCGVAPAEAVVLGAVWCRALFGSTTRDQASWCACRACRGAQHSTAYLDTTLVSASWAGTGGGLLSHWWLSFCALQERCTSPHCSFHLRLRPAVAGVCSGRADRGSIGRRGPAAQAC